MVLEEQGLLQQFHFSQTCTVIARVIPVRELWHRGRQRSNQTERRDGIAPVASQLLCSLVQALRAPCAKPEKA
jgi:hypothetical protein